MSSTEALMQLLAQRKAQVSRIKTEKPPANRSRWRILPSWRGADPQFWMDFGQHFVKDAAGQIKAVYVCSDKTFGKPCQVCEAISQGIQMSHDDVTKKRLEDARSSGRVLLNAIRVDGPSGMNSDPVILEVPPTVFNGHKGVGGIISLFEQWPTLLDPSAGHDIIIEKAGTGKETRYGVQIAGGSQPVPPQALAKLHDLDKFVQTESEEAARRALQSVAAISGLPAPASAPALTAPVGYPSQMVYPAGGGAPMEVYAPPAAAPAPVAAYPAETVVAQPVYPQPVAQPAVMPQPVYQPQPVAQPAAPVYQPQPVAQPAPQPVYQPQPVAQPVPQPQPVVMAPAAPVAQQVPTPPVASTGDAELDALLHDLGPSA